MLGEEGIVRASCNSPLLLESRDKESVFVQVVVAAVASPDLQADTLFFVQLNDGQSRPIATRIGESQDICLGLQAHYSVASIPIGLEYHTFLGRLFM